MNEIMVVLMLAGVISLAIFVLGLVGELLHWYGFFKKDDQ